MIWWNEFVQENKIVGLTHWLKQIYWWKYLTCQWIHIFGKKCTKFRKSILEANSTCLKFCSYFPGTFFQLFTFLLLSCFQRDICICCCWLCHLLKLAHERIINWMQTCVECHHAYVKKWQQSSMLLWWWLGDGKWQCWVIMNHKFNISSFLFITLL